MPSGMRGVLDEGGAAVARSHLRPLLESGVVPCVGLRCLSRRMSIVHSGSGVLLTSVTPVGLVELVQSRCESCRIEPVHAHAGRTPLIGGAVECYAALTGRASVRLPPSG